MRIEVTLQPEKSKYIIPINYNYPLSAAIYKVFANSGPRFAEWLHLKGFSIDDGKRFKFFNFSRLNFEEMTIHKNSIIGEGLVRFNLSSPIEDTLVLNFINGLLSSKGIYIGSNESGTNFKVLSASIKPIPVFDFDMKFIMQSPTVVSIKNSADRIIYLKPSDIEIKNALAINLKNKYKVLFNKTYHEFLDIQLDLDYIQKKGGDEAVMKLITIKENTSSQAKIKGFMTPFRIIADPKLIKLAYYCGIGEKNSLGFGAIEVIKRNLHSKDDDKQ